MESQIQFLEDIAKVASPHMMPYWYEFYKMCQIPHPSGHESGLIDYIVKMSESKGHDVIEDTGGMRNVVVDIPANNGSKNVVCFQAHTDMVSEKADGIIHDFEKDPIQPYVDGDRVRARGTTLGGDNLAGVADAVNIINNPDSFKHPKLRLLFTVGEESGFDGALATKLDLGDVTHFINGDSEEGNEIFIGSASAIMYKGTLADSISRTHDIVNYNVLTLKDFRGGHSGADIHKAERGNAINLTGLLLSEVMPAVNGFIKIISINGGNGATALPTACEVKFYTDPSDVDISNLLAPHIAEIKKNHKNMKGEDVSVDLRRDNGPVYLFSYSESNNIVNVLNSLSSGVKYISSKYGNTETSNNFGSIKTEGDNITIVGALRSSNHLRELQVYNSVRSTISSNGFNFEKVFELPGWEPIDDFPLLRIAVEEGNKIYGANPISMVNVDGETLYLDKMHVKTIHAGLECAVFKKMFPNAQYISLGPKMEGVHSPSEYLHIRSVENNQAMLKNILSRL